MYEEWCKTFDPEQHKGEISELLVNVPEIRALYAKLVGICTLFFYNDTLLCVSVILLENLSCFLCTGVCIERGALKAKTDSLRYIHGQVTLLSQYLPSKVPNCHQV